MITHETRRQSHKEILGTLGKRHEDIIKVLRQHNDGVTASELTIEMWDKNYFIFPDRNYVHPRLNELANKGLVSVVEKRKGSITGKTVGVYKLVDING